MLYDKAKKLHFQRDAPVSSISCRIRKVMQSRKGGHRQWAKVDGPRGVRWQGFLAALNFCTNSISKHLVMFYSVCFFPPLRATGLPGLAWASLHRRTLYPPPLKSGQSAVSPGTWSSDWPVTDFSYLFRLRGPLRIWTWLWKATSLPTLCPTLSSWAGLVGGFRWHQVHGGGTQVLAEPVN